MDVIGIKGFLALSAIVLVLGFLGWFCFGTISFANQSTTSAIHAWQGISGLVVIFLGSIWSSIVIIAGFSILALLVWCLARIFAQYEDYNPLATIVYQVTTPVVVIPISLLFAPLLLPYAVQRVFSGNGANLIGQAKQIGSLFAPPEVKSLPGSKDSTSNF